jgi:hypothetical protein
MASHDPVTVTVFSLPVAVASASLLQSCITVSLLSM